MQPIDSHSCPDTPGWTRVSRLVDPSLDAPRMRRFANWRRSRFARLVSARSAVVAVAAIVALGGGYVATSSHIVLASMHKVPGFKVKDFEINGNRELAAEEVAQLIGLSPGQSLLELDVGEARERIKQHRRISEATVRKVYPDRLIVDIVERQPFALWKNGGQLNLIARDGAVIGRIESDPPALPQVVGPGADEAAAELVAEMSKYPMIGARVTAYVRVGERRWNLILKDGPRVLLPETDWKTTLSQLYSLQAQREVLDRDIVQLDMRLPDRLIVRLQPEAARNRSKLIQESLERAKGERT